ncbi:hypothetical protein AGMMS50230_22840 [Spirochaetia bacterium]|nr:hypothetical protein AGMMS50230_22840 [Spirochaetia bacterium]
MKSITIHGISDELDRKIAEKSRELDLSQNKTIKCVLEKALLANLKEARRARLMKYCGSWTAEDAAEFDEATKDLGEVNEADWI